MTGIDASRPSLAPVTPSQIVKGSYLHGTGYEALVSQSYANAHSIAVGDTLTLFGKTFHVVGISRAPLGATPSDITVDLGMLQRLAGYTGEVNGIDVRATSASHVDAVAAAIKAALTGSSVTTASDLANRVGGSLNDARNLSSRLGTALEVAGLLAAGLVACLLTLRRWQSACARSAR